MTFELFWHLTALLFGLLFFGTIACLPLFKWNIRKLITSDLFIKIIWWCPIFLILISVLYFQLVAALFVTGLVISLALREFFVNHAYKSKAAIVYMIWFCASMTFLVFWFVYLPFPMSVAMLAALSVASVLSDVCAFFFGTYAGAHALPRWLNDRKSWEGVIGQIVGAGVGAILATVILGITLPLALVVLIGVASAAGDLFNSFVKRALLIKDWGATIPGHGGVLDRLSSLSFALIVGFWFLVLQSVTV